MNLKSENVCLIITNTHKNHQQLLVGSVLRGTRFKFTVYIKFSFKFIIYLYLNDHLNEFEMVLKMNGFFPCIQCENIVVFV